MKIITTIFTLLLFFCLIFSVVSSGQTNDLSNFAEKQKDKNQSQEKDKPLEIKSKPRAEMGDCLQSSGLTRLRVTFDKTAKVTFAEIVIASGCEGFDKRAIKAAKGIKFKPAVKNGEPVTVVKSVEYIFQKY